MTPSERIDKAIAELNDWRGEMLARIRELVHEADPEIVEEWKWSSPVWSHDGLVCSANAFKKHVGMNFFKGASLEDPHGIFNSGLDAKQMRSIKLNEGDAIDEGALKEMVRAAVTLNRD